MKRQLLSIAIVLFTTVTTYSQTLKNSVFVDFGPNDGTNGDATGQISGGNFWNDITNAGVSVLSTTLKNSAAVNTSILLDVTVASQTNGKLNGGLLNPDAGLLGEFAVPTATQDFFFTGTTASFKFSGLNPSFTYVFKLFGTRDNAEIRKTEFKLTGTAEFSYIQQTSGAGAGANGANTNNNTITTSAAVTPNASGVITLDVIRNTGTFGFINALKIEEYQPAVMPLQLKSFSGKALPNENSLSWTTENETNVSHFEIESSTNNSDFSKIAEKNAGQNSYIYNDANIAAGVENFYYRLKTIDNDGTSNYSKTIVVNNTITGSQINVYPNPFTTNLTVESARPSAEITISSMDGKQLKHFVATNRVSIIDLKELEFGAYIVKIKTAEGTTSKTVIKQ